MDQADRSRLHGFSLKEFIFPFLVLASFFGDTNILAGKTILGVKTNLSIGDLSIISLVTCYLYFYWDEVFKDFLEAGWVVFIGMLFMLCALLSGIIGNPHWVISTKTWIKVYLLFFILIPIFRTSSLSRQTLTFFVVLVIMLNVVGVLEYMYCQRPLMNKFLLIFRIKESVHDSNHLVSSLFTNSNPYGVFNSLFFVTILSIWFGHRGVINDYMAALGLTLSSIGIFFSGSRNAIVSLVTGLVTLAIYLTKKGRGLRLLGICVLVVSFIFFASIEYNGYVAYKLGQVIPAVKDLYLDKSPRPADFKINLDFSGLRDRLRIWHKGINKLKEKPLLGWGASSTRFWLGFSKPYSMHNFYLEILVTNGILGFAFIMALIAMWLSRLRTGWCWAPVLVLLVSGLFDEFFDLCPAWLVFVAWIIALTTKDITTGEYSRNSSSEYS